jgi:hypothetical protein
VRLAHDHRPADGRKVTDDHGHAPSDDPADDHGWPARGAPAKPGLPDTPSHDLAAALEAVLSAEAAVNEEFAS